MADNSLPNRGSVVVKNGQEWTVVDLTTRYVRLLGSTGTTDVPIWKWPDGFAPRRIEEQEGEHPIQALLVGGDLGKHLDRLEEMARGHGVDIVAHWPGRLTKIPNKQIPANIDAVIFLFSHISHNLYETVKPLAVESGLPVLHVPSQGFEAKLTEELDRLGLRQKFSGEYLLPVAEPAQGRYTWTGSTWSWQESEEVPVVAEAAWDSRPGVIEGKRSRTSGKPRSTDGETLVATMFALGPLLLLRR